MARFDHESRFLNAKIVYYGPPLSGKTTNLVTLHRLVDPEGGTRLFSLNTQEDRTLFFDMMPLEVGKILNHTLRLQIYTVPGQVHYRSTRRMILQGADACVFVADSRPDRMGSNLAALEDLRDNLAATGHDLSTFPIVIQYNKRDVSTALPIEELNRQLNVTDHPSLGCVATSGEGIIETIRFATQGLVRSLIDRFGGQEDTVDGDESTDQVDAVFHKFLLSKESVTKRGIPEWVRNYPRAEAESPAHTSVGSESIEVFGDINAPARHDVEPPGDDRVEVLDSEQLLESSLHTQMRIAEEYNTLRRENVELAEKCEHQQEQADHTFDKLLEADQQHEDLLASLSADLAGPLTALAEKVEQVASSANQEEAQNGLAVAREESQKIKELVREILTARGSTSGSLSASQALDGAKASCRAAFEKKNVEIDIKLEDNLPALDGEPARLGFALTKVLEHAIECSPEGRAVRVRVSYKEMELKSASGKSEDRRFISIQIRDFSSGHGKNEWEGIFAPDRDNQLSDLAKSRDILRRLGGVMQVKSRPGKGNLVTLYVPVAESLSYQVPENKTA